jgi:hypothetical protein
MANLTLNKVQYQSSSEDYNWETAGTVASNFKGHTMRFTNNNIANDKKRLTIITKKGKDEFTLSCSGPLSIKVRKALKEGLSKKSALSALVQLDLNVDPEDNTRYFIFQPQGEANDAFTVADLTEEAISYDELAAY